ncbi:MAG: hypothetical protein ABEJ57_08685 [Halobacteriaceae archaeon]
MADSSLLEAVQRGVLGVLLAVLFFIGLGYARGLWTGAVLSGLAGAVLALATALAILGLFREGLTAGREATRNG